MKGAGDMLAVASSSECANCKRNRELRCRALAETSIIPDELHQAPFTSAPALYSFNVPRYFSIQLRAKEYAKQHNKQLSWCHARDVPLHPNDRDLPTEALTQKLQAWLRRHDQDTSNLTSMLPLVKGLPVRLTDSVDRERQLYRGRRGTIYGWTLDEEKTMKKHIISNFFPILSRLRLPA